MTLLQAISTGSLYRRSGGGFWYKSEKPYWPIRSVTTGAPLPLSEEDIKANDWVIDIRPPNEEWGWIYMFEEWQALTLERKIPIKDVANPPVFPL